MSNFLLHIGYVSKVSRYDRLNLTPCNIEITGKYNMIGSSEFMDKTFQAAQLTHEIFDHRSLLQNIFLISAKLNNLSCVSCAA